MAVSWKFLWLLPFQSMSRSDSAYEQVIWISTGRKCHMAGFSIATLSFEIYRICHIWYLFKKHLAPQNLLSGHKDHWVWVTVLRFAKNVSEIPPKLTNHQRERRSLNTCNEHQLYFNCFHLVTHLSETKGQRLLWTDGYGPPTKKFSIPV